MAGDDVSGHEALVLVVVVGGVVASRVHHNNLVETKEMIMKIKMKMKTS